MIRIYGVLPSFEADMGTERVAESRSGITIFYWFLQEGKLWDHNFKSATKACLQDPILMAVDPAIMRFFFRCLADQYGVFLI